MFRLTLFMVSAIVTIWFITGFFVTAWHGVSVVCGRAERKPIAYSRAMFCESAGILLAIGGLVFMNRDVTCIGGLLIGMGGLLCPAERRDYAIIDVVQYGGALGCIASLAVYYFVARFLV